MPTSIEGMTRPEEIRPGIHIVPIAMPGGPIPYSLCYLIEDDRGGVHVVDPGWSSEKNAELLSAALESIGHTVDDVVQIVVTHLHADHLGGADQLRAASGAPLILHAAEQAALDAPPPAPPLAAWGVPAGRRAELRPSTARPAARPSGGPPGIARRRPPRARTRAARAAHAGPHHRPHLPRRPDAGLVFTGDHVLPTINSGLGLGGAQQRPTRSPTTSIHCAAWRSSTSARRALGTNDRSAGSPIVLPCSPNTSWSVPAKSLGCCERNPTPTCGVSHPGSPGPPGGRTSLASRCSRRSRRRPCTATSCCRVSSRTGSSRSDA